MVDLKKLNPLNWFNQNETDNIKRISTDDMQNFSGFGQSWTGEKFLGGFGLTKDYEVVDYWALRKRSKQLFTENLYARGLIRRLITNEINKGLALEATPDNLILGLEDDVTDKWSEEIERRFSIWGKDASVCDFKQSQTFGALQRQARLMAIVSGDVLVILRSGNSGVTNIELIDAEHVQDPSNDAMIRAVKARGNTIEHGVELNQSKKHIAYFILKSDNTYARIPTQGARSGKKQAFLYYGTEKQIDEVRGQSLLALVVQSLKEVDRYRDSELRAAVVNSMVAMWIEKGEDKISSLPLGSGAVRKDSVTTQNDAEGRKDLEISSQMPGMVFQELQHGEKPHSYDSKRPNVNFAAFEEAIINAIAWSNEIPPEILTLGFSSNYSASQAAVSEFKMYLDKVRDDFGDNFLSFVYKDFLIAQVLNDTVQATNFIEAFRNKNWLITGAWCSASWAGAVKPSIDMLKSGKAYELYTKNGWVTNDRASRNLTGMKFSKVVQQLKRENEQLVIAMKPLMDAGLLKDETAPYENINQNEEE